MPEGPYAAKGFFYRDMKMDSLVPSDIVAWDESGISDKVLDSFEKTVNIVRRIILNWYALHHLLRRQHQLTRLFGTGRSIFYEAL